MTTEQDADHPNKMQMIHPDTKKPAIFWVSNDEMKRMREARSAPQSGSFATSKLPETGKEVSS